MLKEKLFTLKFCRYYTIVGTARNCNDLEVTNKTCLGHCSYFIGTDQYIPNDFWQKNREVV